MGLERILVFFMVLSVFLDDFIIGGNDADARRASPFDFYYYYVIFLVFLFFYVVKKKKIPFLPKWFLQSILLLFALSIVTGLSNGKMQFSMYKQIIGITFSSVAYYNLYKFTDFDVKRIFKVYLNISLIIAIFGIIEEIMLLRGMHSHFDNIKRVSLGFYRVYSIMGEPYFLAVALIPALYYYLNKMIGVAEFRNWATLFPFTIIFLCYFFTFSSAGIFGLGIMFILIVYNHGYLNPGSGKFILLMIMAFLVVPNTKLGNAFSLKELEIRATDSYKAFSSKSQLSKDDTKDLNSSTFALYSNYIIAQESFRKNPFTGGGLGTHEKTYDQYFEAKFGKAFKIMFGNFNAKDGNSLFIRLMSETGLFGLGLIFLFIYKFRLKRTHVRNPNLNIYVIINQGAFVVFIIRLMRTGNYIGQGFFLFFFIYYITYKLVKDAEKNELPVSTEVQPV